MSNTREISEIRDEIGQLIVALGYIIDAIPEVSDETRDYKRKAIAMVQAIAEAHNFSH